MSAQNDYYAANMMIVDLVILDDVYDPITINQVLSDLDLETESPTIVLTQLMAQLQGWDDGMTHRMMERLLDGSKYKDFPNMKARNLEDYVTRSRLSLIPLLTHFHMDDIDTRLKRHDSINKRYI
tara:strand:- start:655 stop:1029 length:375 start_codon:yes stop_codon:yes gene_type:complete